MKIFVLHRNKTISFELTLVNLEWEYFENLRKEFFSLSSVKLFRLGVTFFSFVIFLLKETIQYNKKTYYSKYQVAIFFFIKISIKIT